MATALPPNIQLDLQKHCQNDINNPICWQVNLYEGPDVGYLTPPYADTSCYSGHIQLYSIVTALHYVRGIPLTIGEVQW